MAYVFTYCQEFSRIIQSVTIDNRRDNLPPNATGNEIQPIVDGLVSEITPTVIFYKIETMKGNLAGYFTLNVNLINQTVIKGLQDLRPAFQSDLSTINNQINKFIIDGDWRKDYLFPG